MANNRFLAAFSFSFFGNLALLVCLFAPSAWMIMNLPPLWRDSDAYYQVTRNPLITTYWGHGPAYSYVAKIPLFVGEQLERRWMGRSSLVRDPSSETVLTDTGVLLLIVAQHVALCAAAWYFILAVSQFFIIRFLLALIWASNALFYTFAHCIGSETLSLILVILLVAKSIRLIQSERRWQDWYSFAVLLLLCRLSRHVNLWLILLLPWSFLFFWAGTRITTLLARSKRNQSQGAGRNHLRDAFVALAIGVICLAVASSLVSRLARKTPWQPHPRYGFTFLWRLNFLKELAPESRAALLHRVAARKISESTRKLIGLLEQMQEEKTELNAGQFTAIAMSLLSPPGRPDWVKVDYALNEMALAFLLPPTREHLRVAKTEFISALNMSPVEISDYLFQTTNYYFEHRDETPAFANLVTFRDWNAEQIAQLPVKHSYFRLWQGASYKDVLGAWLVSLLLFIAITRGKREPGLTTFATVLVLIGLLMVASTCLLGAFIPRYCLPMWQLLLLAIFILLGQMGDAITTLNEYAGRR